MPPPLYFACQPTHCNLLIGSSIYLLVKDRQRLGWLSYKYPILAGIHFQVFEIEADTQFGRMIDLVRNHVRGLEQHCAVL